jgi:hypothetical protein
LGSESGFLAKGALVSELRIGANQAVSTGSSYVIGDDTSQTLRFSLPASQQQGSVDLVLDHWGLLFAPSISTDAVGASCSS